MDWMMEGEGMAAKARKPLKAPFPAFGGKSRIASVVWEQLGDVANFIEPFANSAAVLLARPHTPKIETLNDMDAFIANFWRATQQDPEAVADQADWPVNEADLHARHRWLVLSDESAAFRQRMRTDPDYYDARIAGWWVWGACCWIGTGWCAVGDEDTEPTLSQQIPAGQRPLTGVHTGPGPKMPNCDRRGIHAAPEDAGPSQQLPMMSAAGRGMDAAASLSQQLPNIGDPPRGGHRGADSKQLSQQLPKLEGYASGIVPEAAGRRPQLADAFSRGRGVHGNDDAETCEQRRRWLLDWFLRLRNRLRTVRVCCGDWLRVCDSDSVTTRLGTTGIFFDPPYGNDADRQKDIYAVDSGTVAADVRKYCLERGGDKEMKIVLAGYAGEGHEELEKHDWSVQAWKAQGGYGNRSEKGKANAKKERLWCSPGCNRGPDLFAALDD